MLAQIGSIMVGLALTAAIYAAAAVVWSIHRGDQCWWESGRNAIVAATGLLGAALAILLAAFLRDEFIIEYVAQHSSRDLPLYLKVSAIWGGQEGSLLLWAFLQALFGALFAGRPSRQNRALVRWASVFLSLIAVFFVGVTLFLSNPFTVSATAPLDGRGLNPLLRHPGMVFHPPPMYLGYVGLAVPFSLALAGLLTRRIDVWPSAARSWALAAWLFLGLGLLLGMRWAYDVLGWGGYWGWDPVENAGLMPWLTATAMLHTLVMQDQGRGFRGWNVTLAVLSFILVLFGTFTTRSGLIQSVHAFARSKLGPYFLAAMGLTLCGSLALLYSRRSLLSGSSSTGCLVSREGTSTLTVILFLTLTGSVFIGTVLPTLTEPLIGQRFEASPGWFDRVTGPQFAALVLLMGICPLLGRATTPVWRLRREGAATLFGGAIALVGGALAGFNRPLSLIGFAVVGMAAGTVLAEIARGAVRRRREGARLPAALWWLLGRNRRRYGGHLVHLGVVLMAVGVIGTRFYSFEAEAVLGTGGSMDVEGYTLTYGGLERAVLSDRAVTQASVLVHRDGRLLGSLGPGLEVYGTDGQTVGIPAVRSGIREDVYLVLAGWSDGGEQVTLKVFINSLISFLWLGGMVFTVGGVVALWPSGKGLRRPTAAAEQRRLWGTTGLVAGILFVALAAVAIWSPAWGALVPTSDSGEQGLPLTGRLGTRPRVGDPAPDFTLDLLDGGTLSLSELGDDIVVVNFWSPQCQPCRDEIPDLQTVWEEYENEGVTFVGISFPELETEVRDMASEFGITYRNGMSAAAVVGYGITAVPETFIVGRDGRIAYVHIGPVTAGRLREELDSLVAE